MTYPTLWTFAFIALFTGYLAFAGLNYGVGITLTATARDDRERRSVLGSLGPFLLGNEAWLLVSLGILVGTLPGLKTQFFVGAQPYVLTALAGSLTLTSAALLRSRHPGAAVRRRWDRVICAAGTATAFGWGAFLAAVAGGLDLDAEGHVTGTGAVFTLFALSGGLTLVALLAAYGAAFTAGRVPGAVGVRAARLAGRLVPGAGALLLLTAVVGLTGGRLDGAAFNHPAVVLGGTVVLLAALAFARQGLATGRPGRATLAAGTAVALLPLAVLAAKYPYLGSPVGADVPAVPVQELAADSTSLALITWTAGPVLLLVIAVQARVWWALRPAASPDRSVTFPTFL